MSDLQSYHELDRTIAEWIGWRNIEVSGITIANPPYVGTPPGQIGGKKVRIPAYSSDLNEVHEAEKKLSDYQYDLYYGPFLGAVTKAKTRRDIASAGARHRSEALVKVIEEGKK